MGEQTMWTAKTLRAEITKQDHLLEKEAVRVAKETGAGDQEMLLYVVSQQQALMTWVIGRILALLEKQEDERCG